MERNRTTYTVETPSKHGGEYWIVVGRERSKTRALSLAFLLADEFERPMRIMRGTEVVAPVIGPHVHKAKEA
jgi:hypothetical protein